MNSNTMTLAIGFAISSALVVPGTAQQITGTPGSPRATTTSRATSCLRRRQNSRG
jgi:hypothetical protein